MATDVGTQPAARRRRDRKAQLAGLAADLFRQRGYHAVGIGDIAAAAGITGPAVYRHFSNKQDILAHVLLSGVDTLAETVAEHLDRPGTPAARMHALTDAFARLAVERRDAVALWRWLGRHLDRERRVEVRRRGDALSARWSGELRRLRPELEPADADLLCRAAMGVFGSPASYTVTLGKARHTRLLGDLAAAVLESSVADSGDATPTRGDGGSPGPLAASRREVLLTQATRLFRERGYHSVTMEEIGAAAGIAGPSVYRHFSGKSDLMRAACARMADRLVSGAARAIAGAGGPAEALDRLTASYAGILVAHRDLMAVYIAELSNLSEEHRGELRRLQRGYVAEWVRLITAASPGVSAAEARVVAHAALTIANDLARSGRMLARPGLEAEIAALMRAVVHRPLEDPDVG